MITKPNITGIILAGGKSRRMGEDKGLLLLNGKTMIEYTYNALSEICGTILIISNNASYNKYSKNVYPDKIKNKGPMAGIYTGLLQSKTDVNIVCTCDSPYITASLLSTFVEYLGNYDAVIPAVSGRMYPLTAVYRKSCYSQFKTHLDNDVLKVKDALLHMNVKMLKVDKLVANANPPPFHNINTPEDLKIFE